MNNINKNEDSKNEDSKIDKFGIIIIRHVKCKKTNEYWNYNVSQIRKIYLDDIKIVIIDDNSDHTFVKSFQEYNNIVILNSEYPGRGELLPYYYYIHNKFFEYALIIHDSVFFHKRFDYEKLIEKDIDIVPLWHFTNDKDRLADTLLLAHTLKNKFKILEMAQIPPRASFGFRPGEKWMGCFGCMAFLSHNFLLRIQQKYNITNMLPYVSTRSHRQSLERILGVIFSIEKKPYYPSSILGNIMLHGYFGYKYECYLWDIERENKTILKKPMIKVFTGR